MLLSVSLRSAGLNASVGKFGLSVEIRIAVMLDFAAFVKIFLKVASAAGK